MDSTMSTDTLDRFRTRASTTTDAAMGGAPVSPTATQRLPPTAGDNHDFPAQDTSMVDQIGLTKPRVIYCPACPDTNRNALPQQDAGLGESTTWSVPSSMAGPEAIHWQAELIRRTAVWCTHGNFTSMAARSRFGQMLSKRSARMAVAPASSAPYRTRLACLTGL
jgi:hypothetical protein